MPPLPSCTPPALRHALWRDEAVAQVPGERWLRSNPSQPAPAPSPGSLGPKAGVPHLPAAPDPFGTRTGAALTPAPRGHLPKNGGDDSSKAKGGGCRGAFALGFASPSSWGGCAAGLGHCCPSKGLAGPRQGGSEPLGSGRDWGELGGTGGLPQGSGGCPVGTACPGPGGAQRCPESPGARRRRRGVCRGLGGASCTRGVSHINKTYIYSVFMVCA